MVIASSFCDLNDLHMGAVLLKNMTLICYRLAFVVCKLIEQHVVVFVRIQGL